jgi:hypothetical protein
VILRVAEEIKCDFIVMGTHGRTGPSHWLTGHISDKVVRRARCGVLTLPYPFPENEPPLLNVRWEMAASTPSKADERVKGAKLRRGVGRTVPPRVAAVRVRHGRQVRRLQVSCESAMGQPVRGPFTVREGQES